MSNGDRKPEERLAAIEALIQERKETTKTWQDKADIKLDKLLSNNKHMVTMDALEQAFTAHITSCSARSGSNPKPNDKNGNKLDLILRGYRGLGIAGSMIVLNGMLTVIILKLAKVF